MRTVTFGGANSLNNYLARSDHAVDWLQWGEEAAAVMADYWTSRVLRLPAVPHRTASRPGVACQVRFRLDP